MNAYERDARSTARKKIGSKKKFLREIIKEVRVKRNEVTLTYKIPLGCRTGVSKTPSGKFFTVLQMVVAAGLEPATSRM